MASNHQPLLVPIHLLSLPREIRNIIYELLLISDTSGPPSDEYIIVMHTVRIPKHAPKASSAALLCCNHQARSEMLEVISQHARSFPNGLIYSLEIPLQYTLDARVLTMSDGIGERNQALPHWAKMPVVFPTNHRKSLIIDCSARVEDVKDAIGSAVNLMSHYLEHGLHYSVYPRRPPPGFFENLIINVLPVGPWPACSGDLQSHPAIHPMLERRTNFFVLLLLCNYISGNVGCMSLQLDGKLVKQWDVSLGYQYWLKQMRDRENGF